jgi:hypothetical protein
LADPENKIREENDSKAQLLMSVVTNRNKYILQTPMVYKIKNAKDKEEIKNIYERDMENFYGDLGE